YHVKPDVYQASKDKIAATGLEVLHLKTDEEEIYTLRNRNPDPVNDPDAFCPLASEGDDAQVVKTRGRFVLKDTEIEGTGRADKMSKSRKNVVNPDKVVKQFGADSLRLYEMFMGPLEATKPWNMRGVDGVYRFLGRVWRLLIDDRAEQVKLNDSVQDVE